MREYGVIKLVTPEGEVWINEWALERVDTLRKEKVKKKPADEVVCCDTLEQFMKAIWPYGA